MLVETPVQCCSCGKWFDSDKMFYCWCAEDGLGDDVCVNCRQEHECGDPLNQEED